MKNSFLSMSMATMAFACSALVACQSPKVEKDLIQDNIDNAVAQFTIQTDLIEKSG